jgi:hypothetical protein
MPGKPSVRITGRQDRDLNPGPPEYEAGMLTTRPRSSVYMSYKIPESESIKLVIENILFHAEYA